MCWSWNDVSTYSEASTKKLFSLFAVNWWFQMEKSCFFLPQYGSNAVQFPSSSSWEKWEKSISSFLLVFSGPLGENKNQFSKFLISSHPVGLAWKVDFNSILLAGLVHLTSSHLRLFGENISHFRSAVPVHEHVSRASRPFFFAESSGIFAMFFLGKKLWEKVCGLPFDTGLKFLVFALRQELSWDSSLAWCFCTHDTEQIIMPVLKCSNFFGHVFVVCGRAQIFCGFFPHALFDVHLAHVLQLDHFSIYLAIFSTYNLIEGLLISF